MVFFLFLTRLTVDWDKPRNLEFGLAQSSNPSQDLTLWDLVLGLWTGTWTQACQYYSTFFLHDIIDSLSKSTEGENQLALIDNGKKENDLVAVLVLARPTPCASQQCNVMLTSANLITSSHLLRSSLHKCTPHHKVFPIWPWVSVES